MPTFRWIIPLAAVALIHAPASAERQKTWQKTFTVTTHPSVKISGGDGSVHVRTGPAGTVYAEVLYEYKRWGFTTTPRDPAVTLEQKGNDIEIGVREPTRIAIFGGISEHLVINVTVPAECDLGVRSEDGAVSIDAPIQGRFDISTEDGRVTLRGVHGDLRLSSEDGVIDASGLDGSVVAHAEDGRVLLDGRFDVLDVRSADGRVNVVARPGSQLSGEWRLETQDGPLALAIPRDLKAELDARTGDGRIHFDLPVTVSGGVNPHIVRGRLNGGGALLRLRTQDGSLTLSVSE